MLDGLTVAEFAFLSTLMGTSVEDLKIGMPPILHNASFLNTCLIGDGNSLELAPHFI